MRRLKFAFRTLFRSPFVTTIAVLSLGLGIGANSAIFSLFDQILMRPLPVATPTELVNLSGPGPKNGSVSSNQSGDSDAVFSYPMFRDLEREQQSFTGIAAHRIFGANIGYEGQTLLVDGILVSGNYFDVLGLRPANGRLIQPDDPPRIGLLPFVVHTGSLPGIAALLWSSSTRRAASERMLVKTNSIHGWLSSGILTK